MNEALVNQTLIPGFHVGMNCLVTTDDWFYAPNGHSYKCAWGPLHAHSAADALGFKPTNSTNWIARIGEGPGALLIFGCRIHFIAACPFPPDGRDVYCFQPSEPAP